MGNNIKFNSDELDLEGLIDELTLSGQVQPVLAAKEDSSLEASKESTSTINAESIELEVPNQTLEGEVIVMAPLQEDSKKKETENTTDLNTAPEEEEEEEELLQLAEPHSIQESSLPLATLDLESNIQPLQQEESQSKIDEPKLIKIPFPENTEMHTSITTPSEELRVQPLPTSPSNPNSNLKTVEYLSIAQNKIIELQKTIEHLHEENSNIIAAGELWKKRSNQSEQSLTEIKDKHQSIKNSKETEQRIFTLTIDKQNKKIESMKKDLNEAEFLTEEKLSTYKLISSDLENRIEIIEREKLTLLDGKNKFISDLQRQINTLKKINTNDKKKLQQISNLVNEKEKTLRNTIKLLRQTLINLEIGDNQDSALSLVS